MACKNICINLGTYPGVNNGPDKLLLSQEVEKCVYAGKKIPRR